MTYGQYDDKTRTTRGNTADRPAVSFYEVGGFKVDASDPDPYNIYNPPDWQPLLRLAEEVTDVIRMVKARKCLVDSSGSSSSQARN